MASVAAGFSFLFLLLLLPPAARADSTWNVASGTWSNAANWLGGLPGGSDTAILNNSGTALLSGGISSFVGIVYTGTTSGSSGTIAINGASLTSSNFYLGQAVGGSGVATIASGTWNNSGQYWVGGFGTGSMTINSGGRLTGSYAAVGAQSGGVGSITINGGTLVNSTDLDLGVFGGAGNLTILGSGVVNTQNTRLGYNSSARGTATVTSGSLINSGQFYAGYSGTGSLLLNGGYLSASISSVGFQAGSSGTATVTSGTWSTANDLFVGQQGKGVLNISGGLVSANRVFGGALTGGNGSIALSGSGVLATTQIREDDGSATLHLDGGLVRVTGNQIEFLPGYEAGDVTINSGGAFIDTNGFAIGIGAPLSGVGALTKQGAGMLTLSGSNGYSGGTVINSGTLRLGHANALGATSGSMTINNGTLDLYGKTVTVGALSGGSGAVITSGTTGALYFTSSQSTNTTFAGSIQSAIGNVSLIKEGAGTLTLSGSSAYQTTLISAGTLVVTGSLNSEVGVGANGGTGSLILSGGSISSSFGAVGYGGNSNGTATVSSGTWSNSGNMYVGYFGTGTLNISGGLVNGSGTVFTGADLGKHGTINLSGSSGNRGVLSTNRLVEGAGTSTIILDGGILRAGANQSDFLSDYEAGDVTINSGGAFINSGSYAIGISTVLGGTGALNKDGTGTLTLSGSNGYSGGTVINSGTLRLGHDNALGSTSGSLTINNGTLDLSSNSITVGALSGNSGALITSGSAGFLTITSNQSTDTTYAGSIQSGSAFVGLEKIGVGTLTLSGSNSFNYYTIVSSGTLVIASGGSINGGNITSIFAASGGSASLVISGGNVSDTVGYVGQYFASNGTATITSGTWNNSSETSVGVEGVGSLAINGGIVTDQYGSIGGASTGTGTVTVTSGTWDNSVFLRIGHDGVGSLNISGGLVNVTGTAFTGANAGSRGTLTLSGSNGNRGVLSASRIMEVSGTGTINLDGGVLRARNSQSDLLSGYEAGDVTIQTGGAFVDTNGFAIGINTVLSGSGALTKQGAGTLTLSGSSSYLGGTVVNSGTLAVGHNNAVGSGEVTVNAGTFLVQSGFTVANPVTLSGGTMVEIFSAGTNLADTINSSSDLGGKNTGAALLEGTTTAIATIGSHFAVTSLASNDVVRLSDVFDLSGIPIINIGTGETDMFVLQLQIVDVSPESFLGWLDTNTNTWVNAVFGNIGGVAAFQGDGAYNPGSDFVLGYYGVDTANDTVWAVLNHNSDFSIVPEPSTLALLGLGALFFLHRRKVRG